jgi:hypothetical protein
MTTKPNSASTPDKGAGAADTAQPPAAEDVLAYYDGKLSGDRAARVQELLVAHPEMVRAALAPFPEDDARPGDPDYLAPEELDRRWESLQQRVHAPSGARVLQFWRVSAAIAASLAIAFGVMLWQSQSSARAPRVILNEQVLLPDGQRGPNAELPVALTTETDSYLLVVPVLHAADFNDYRLELVSPGSTASRPLWRSATVSRPPNDTLAIVVPRAFLPGGRYQVVLYGLSGGRDERLATYSVSVPGR